MSPAELDAKILAKLDGSPCILAELAERVGASAKDILKRLHVLGGMKKVACERQAGSLVWGLFDEVAPKERPEREAKPPPKRAPAPTTAGLRPGATETALAVMERTEAARADDARKGAPPAARGHLPDPSQRIGTIAGPAPGTSPAGDFYRRESERIEREEECPNPWQVVVVRERTCIPEIRVTKLPREVIIAMIHDEPAKSEGVCIPRDPTVLAALIDALKQVMP